jgi:hypothetical protein
MFVILCRSYGARADFGFGSYKDVAPTELDLTSAFSNRLLMSACAERPDIMHQIPNVVVRFDFSERGHPAESDAILHDPEEFTIGICLYITRCKVRCARVHPSTIVCGGVAVGAMAHCTISGVEFVSFLDAGLQIAGRRGDTLAAPPTNKKVFCLGRKNGFQMTRLVNRVESYLSKSRNHRHCSQCYGNDYNQHPALHPFRKATRKPGEGRLTLSQTGYDAALIAVT